MRFRWKAILLLLTAAAALGLLLEMNHAYQGERIGFSRGGVMKWNEGWSVYTDRGGEGMESRLPVSVPVRAGGTLILENTVPDFQFYGMTLLVWTKRQSIRVCVGDDVIYEYGTKSSDFWGGVPGNRWNLISVSPYVKGKTLRIEISSQEASYAGRIGAVFYGEKSEILFYLIRNYAVGFLAAIAVMLLGIGCLGYYVIGVLVSKRLNSHSPALSLSLFAIAIAVWMLGESRVLQFFTGNQVLLGNISYLALLLIPLLQLWFIDSVCRSAHKKFVIPGLILLHAAAAFLCIGITFFAKQPLFRVIRLEYAALGVSIVTLAVFFFRELLIYKNREIWPVLLSFGCLLLSAGLETAYYYLVSRESISFFLRIGMLLFILIFSVTSIKKSQRIQKESQEARYYQRLAYRDLLTGGNNRTAYYRDLENWEREEDPENLRLILLDLNNLKRINDGYGHQAGDDALKRTYRCMEKAFGEDGNCYRIGGDEFACILFPCGEEELCRRVKEFNELVRQTNSETEYPFSVAMGVGTFDRDRDRNFEGLSIRVDRLMYANKQELKQTIQRTGGEKGQEAAAGMEAEV